MFEKLVRPFQTRLIGTTRRIVPIKVDDTPGEAKIAWGAVGMLPEEKVQPKGVNLENIESVGFNVKGNIDNFHQTSREDEQVAIPVRDEAGNQIGETTVARAKSITYNKKELDKPSNFGPSANFGYNQNYTTNPDGNYAPYMANFTGVAEVQDRTLNGLRKDIPSNNTSQRTDFFKYPQGHPTP